MSQENVEVVQRVYALLADVVRGQLDDVVFELTDPNIVWDVSRRTFDPGVFHGHQGLRDFAARLAEVWESGRAEPAEFIATGDEVVVPVRLHLVSRTQGNTVTANAAHVWTLREGKIIRHRAFQTKAEALEAVGLRE